MEAFSLLKYWRGGGGLGGTVGGGGGNAGVNARSAATAGGTTTIVTAVTGRQAADTDDDDDDDGPFFDLEFAVPDEDETEETEENEEIDKDGDDVEDEESEDQNDDIDRKSDDGCSDGEREFNFTLSSGSSNDRSDPNLTLSPSDDLFFKGRLVPIEPSSSLDSKPPQFPVSLLKSATKFRVFLLRFKKSKLNSTEKTESASANDSVSAPTATPKKQDTTQEENNNKNKFFTVKFKVEEVPIMSLFSRDNSKSQKQQSSEDSVSDEKKFSKDVMQKYFKKVKPLYVRVSRRYGEKLRFSGQLSLGSLKPATPTSTASQKSVSGKVPATEKGQVEVEVGESQVNGKNLKQVNIPAGLRVVCKHLGKSRSASSAVAAAPPAPALSQRRDDSLLQQQDGIQSAILHCKRSFNGSRDSSESSLLPRSVSDPSHEKSINLSRKSSEDETKERMLGTLPPCKFEDQLLQKNGKKKRENLSFISESIMD